MKKLLVLVLVTAMSLGLAKGQTDESRKEYFTYLDSMMTMAEADPQAALEFGKQIQERWGLASDLMFCQGVCNVYMEDYGEAAMLFSLGASSWKKDDYYRIGAYYKALVAIFAEIGDYQNALKYANKGIKQDKNFYILYYQRGECYKELGNYKKAIADFKKASKDDDYFSDAMAGMALCYAEMGNMKAGRKALEESLQRNTYHGESRRLRALFALTNQDFEAFIDDYMMYMQISKPADPMYIFGVCSEQEKYYDYAIHYAKEILAGQEDSLDIAYWEWATSMIELRGGNETEMWKHAQKAKEMNPGNTMLDTKILQQYAIHYSANDELDKLLVALDTLIARDNENNYNLHSARGDVLRQQKKFEEAVASYEKALTMGIDDLDDKKWLFYRMAGIYDKELKDADKAIACYDSLLAMDPTATSTMYQMAEIHLRMKKDTAKANEIYNRIIETEKKMELNSDAYSQFAFAQMGRFAEAEAFQKQLDELIEKADKTMKGVFYYNAACLYSIIGKSEEAIEKLMSAIDEGIGTCETLKNDEDFNNIRETDEFKAIEKMVCTAEEEDK